MNEASKRQREKEAAFIRKQKHIALYVIKPEESKQTVRGGKYENS